MAEPIGDGTTSGITGGSVNISFGKTEEISSLLAKSGATVKDLLDKISAEYTKNVGSSDVWQSKSAENALNKFNVLKAKFGALHEKILMYSAGVKFVADEYRAQENSSIKEADDNLNGSVSA